MFVVMAASLTPAEISDSGRMEGHLPFRTLVPVIRRFFAGTRYYSSVHNVLVSVNVDASRLHVCQQSVQRNPLFAVYPVVKFFSKRFLAVREVLRGDELWR